MTQDGPANSTRIGESATATEVGGEGEVGVTVNYRSYDGSTFVLEYTAGEAEKPVRVIVDPWLQGELIFAGSPSVYRAKKPIANEPMSIFGEFDAIILTQHLPDHCHPPTLELMSKDLPVLAPTCAKKELDALGFKKVTYMSPNDRVFPLPEILPGFRLTAGKGSIVGPPWSKPQLAFFFEFAESRRALDAGHAVRIYHETHGVHDPAFLRDITSGGRVLDVLISPVVSTSIPLAGNYALVNGIPELLEACRITKPLACVPFDNSKTPATGMLNLMLSSSGSLEEFKIALSEDSELADTKIISPTVNEALLLGARGAFRGSDTDTSTEAQ